MIGLSLQQLKMDKILKNDLVSPTINWEINLSGIPSGQLEDRWNPEPDSSNSNLPNSNLALVCTLLKLGLKFKNCQLQSSNGASKRKPGSTGSFPEDRFSLPIRGKREMPCGWQQQLSKTGYRLAGPEAYSSDLDEAQATQAVQEFVWISSMKSGWTGTKSLNVGGVGAGGTRRESGGEAPWFRWKSALEAQRQVCRHWELRQMAT